MAVLLPTQCTVRRHLLLRRVTLDYVLGYGIRGGHLARTTRGSVTTRRPTTPAARSRRCPVTCRRRGGCVPPRQQAPTAGERQRTSHERSSCGGRDVDARGRRLLDPGAAVRARGARNDPRS